MSAECGMRSAESRPPRNLVCVALEEEAQAIPWKMWGWRTKVLVTGIGRKNAERSVREFFNQHAPERVFTCGFAGALNPLFKTGEVVFDTNESALRERLVNAGATPATFFCSLRIATTVTEKADLRRTTGADAVEMESEAIHAVCRERGVPCATVRVISDTAHEDLPLDFNQLSKPDASLDFGKLALAIAKSPGKIPGLLRLQKNCRFASERLAQVLARVMDVAHVP